MTQDLHHLAAAYALDALAADERAAFEAHYPTCEICATEVWEFRETAAVLATDAADAPPPELKRAVMQRIGETRQMSPLRASQHEVDDDERAGWGGSVGDELADRRARRLEAWVLGGVAAVVLVIAVLFVSGDGGDDFSDVVASADATFATLEGEANAIEAIWSADHERVALVASDLADPGPGRVYALWLLADDGPLPAGLFSPDDAGAVRTVLAVRGGERAPGWAVTIEPAGGSPLPTGEILFAT